MDDVSGDVCVALNVQGAVTLSCLAAGNTGSSFASSRGACQLHYWLTWLFVFQVRLLEDQIFSTNIISAIPCVHLLCLTTLFWLQWTAVSQRKLCSIGEVLHLTEVKKFWKLQKAFSYVCSKFGWFFFMSNLFEVYGHFLFCSIWNWLNDPKARSAWLTNFDLCCSYLVSYLKP